MNFLKALLFPGSRRVSCPLSTLNGEIPVPGFEPELLWIQKGVLPLSYSYSHPLINCCNIGLNLFAKIYAFLLMLCFLLSGVQGSAESSFIQNCTPFNTIYVPTLYFHTVQFRIIFFYCLNGLENKKMFFKGQAEKDCLCQAVGCMETAVNQWRSVESRVFRLLLVLFLFEI